MEFKPEQGAVIRDMVRSLVHRTHVLFLLLMLLAWQGLIACSDYGPPDTTHQSDNKSGASETSPPDFDSSATMLDINSFQGQPKHVKPGDATTLSWKVKGASSVSIEPSVGEVAKTTGSVVVSPTETTLYTLKASDGKIVLESKFLVIVKSMDGSIVWPGGPEATTETMSEDWSYYPNKYIDWIISDKYRDPNGLTDNCWNLGYITNNHPEWTMTEITLNKRVLPYGISPGTKQGYTVSIDCMQLPEMKWKWKQYK